MQELVSGQIKVWEVLFISAFYIYAYATTQSQCTIDITDFKHNMGLQVRASYLRIKSGALVKAVLVAFHL